MIQLLEQVYLSYQDISVLEDFDLNIQPDKITCLVGPSGCGKTSMLNLIAGLVQQNKGHCHKPGNTVGYIFQEDRLLPWATVEKNIALARRTNDQVMIDHLLEVLQLSDFRSKYPYQLSGGMRQRCALARCFYFQSDLLLMDEPFKSLDYDLRHHLIRYLMQLWDETHKTILMVTHDIDEAVMLGHDIILLSRPPVRIVDRIQIKTDPLSRTLEDATYFSVRNQILKQITKL